uniref:uncharacterized protein LOC122595856 isoform X1 n=1 Tax=Erigeron canadensis TaxID=72917 RepID=UPI001CB96ECC|nr:uncharacterized protein LOC122595856 isoform X1 [Erigeron canadensis]XP_043624253.1 uncharacterized protein LOC122595856 isoform X1 [Erigeron canadensis]
MPSLKMKTKSSGEIKGLHVCQKSSKISKNSFFCSRNVQHEAELDTFTPNNQDDSSRDISINQDINREINCCEMVDEIVQAQKHQLSSSDVGIDCLKDHTTNCSSTIETIFSPILESIDNEPNIFDYGGKQWRESDIVLPSHGDNDVDDNSRNSFHCNASDFFISDMIVSSSCNAISGATSLLDYERDESSIFSGDEYMLLPFVEDSMENNSHYEDSSIYMAIHQLKSGNQESDITLYPDLDSAECLDPQMFIRNFLDLSETSTSSGSSMSPRESRETKSVTLVLDLDETLIHSSLQYCDDADFTFPVFSSLKEHTVYVKKRPYLMAFLESVSEMFHIVIFTASQSIYAKKLLDILDPDGKIISHRAYRDSCIYADGSYTKDLTVLGVDLAKVVIIDNSPQVFRLQVNNGIPIESWFDDPSDRALISLLPFLESLVDAVDVRPIIAKRFGYTKISNGSVVTCGFHRSQRSLYALTCPVLLLLSYEIGEVYDSFVIYSPLYIYRAEICISVHQGVVELYHPIYVSVDYMSSIQFMLLDGNVLMVTGLKWLSSFEVCLCVDMDL